MEQRPDGPPRNALRRGRARQSGRRARRAQRARHRRRRAPRRHADGARRHRRRGRHRGDGAAHRDARVEDQLLRRRAAGDDPCRVHRAPQGQAHPRVADAGHRRSRPASLAHDPDPDDPVNGVLAAVVSSALGGSAAALTRYAIGFLLILPLALASGARFPHGADRLAVGALGVLFFAVFFFLYNIAMSLTSAARGSLALSVLPLTTMLAAALLGREELTRRKTCGVLIAIAGVAVALSAGLADAPTGAWRGDLIMALATICMALYNVWSRPLMARS